MRPSPALFAFLRGWEEMRLEPYEDAGRKQTIGYGHLIKPGESYTAITVQEANDLLAGDVRRAADRVSGLLGSTMYSQSQYDALVSFEFNCGGLAKSTLLKYALSGFMNSAADEFPKWDHVHEGTKLVECAGLSRRRWAERQIFRFGDYSQRP